MSSPHIYASEQQVAEAAAKAILSKLDEALSRQPTASLAISGGKSPRLMFDIMAKSGFNWSKVHLFWVDERAVPPTDPQSNYKMAQESLIGPAQIAAANVHRVQAELDPPEAARLYVEDLNTFFGGFPHFDVVHQGMGPDAHTASLFPGQPLIEDRAGIAAAVYVEKMKQFRITLLPGVLLAAKLTVMYVTGADKADAVHAVFHEPYDPKKYPSQLMVHDGSSVSWFFDQAAAARID
ncbi:MAG: 6-phosphogluconolactonase [Acidobacteriaceae bacterium]|nr:6-phosphogluconolactonase [Acidobacteriaceae bacterium]